MRQLILIHGRAQQEKDPAGIKKEWMTAWEKGLAKSGLTNPLTDADIHFPFYGDTLAQMVAGKSAQEAAEVIIKGPEPPSAEKDLMREMIVEMAMHEGVSEADILAELSAEAIEKGPAELALGAGDPVGARQDPAGVGPAGGAGHRRRRQVPHRPGHPESHQRRRAEGDQAGTGGGGRLALARDGRRVQRADVASDEVSGGVGAAVRDLGLAARRQRGEVTPAASHLSEAAARQVVQRDGPRRRGGTAPTEAEALQYRRDDREPRRREQPYRQPTQHRGLSRRREGREADPPGITGN